MKYLTRLLVKLGRLFAATPAFAMPLPAAETGSALPDKDIYTVPLLAVAANADDTAEGIVVKRTGYLTKAAFLAKATLTGANTETRTHNVVDGTTRAVTDGIVATTAAVQGPWNSATAYTAGQVVTLNNLMYACISSVTGGTGPGVDTAHWTQVNALGLNVLTSLTAAFTKDDIGKTISGTGFTAAVITDVLDSQTATVTANSAVRNGLSVTIGASRTIATLGYVSGVTATASTEKDLTLDATDTKVYKGDVLKVTSVHSGSTGLADPGGVMQLEVTSYGEGTD